MGRLLAHWPRWPRCFDRNAKHSDHTDHRINYTCGHVVPHTHTPTIHTTCAVVQTCAVAPKQQTCMLPAGATAGLSRSSLNCQLLRSTRPNSSQSANASSVLSSNSAPHSSPHGVATTVASTRQRARKAQSLVTSPTTTKEQHNEPLHLLRQHTANTTVQTA